MGLFTDVVALFEAGYGWLFVLALLLYEIYAPIVLGKDTALSPLLDDVPETLSSMRDTQEDLRDDVDDLQECVDDIQHTNTVQMQVQRAQARANPEMDEDQVDDYLMKNGVQPDEFLREETDRHDEGETYWYKDEEPPDKSDV
jgi:hypothetical protein